MCFLFSFIPATFWATVGFFVFFAAKKTDGGLAKFGRILAIWIFVVACVLPIIGAWASLSGCCPIDRLMSLYCR